VLPQNSQNEDSSIEETIVENAATSVSLETPKEFI
jgi:hypothetical protein